jgi:hypothetical protein
MQFLFEKKFRNLKSDIFAIAVLQKYSLLLINKLANWRIGEFENCRIESKSANLSILRLQKLKNKSIRP